MTEKKKQKIRTDLKLAKQNYLKLERQLKKAREVLSKAYDAHDDMHRYEHAVKKYGL